jgi:ATP-binding cassette subfamily F protein uup
MKARNRRRERNDFSATRQTKQLIMLEGISYGIRQPRLFKDIHLASRPACVGLVGSRWRRQDDLRLLRGRSSGVGQDRLAEGLRIVYFDQNRELDPDVLCAGLWRG